MRLPPMIIDFKRFWQPPHFRSGLKIAEKTGQEYRLRNDQTGKMDLKGK
jgi:hypothetical protein